MAHGALQFETLFDEEKVSLLLTEEPELDESFEPSRFFNYCYRNSEKEVKELLKIRGDDAIGWRDASGRGGA